MPNTRGAEPASASEFAAALNGRVERLIASALGIGEAWPSQAACVPVPSSASPAPEGEVRVALEAVVKDARAELEALERGGEVSRDVAKALGMRLDRLAEVELERYREACGPAAAPKPAGSLGAIFANVQATASLSPNARAEKWKRQVTVQCKSCGAPQREARNFKCEYCGGDVFRRAYE